MDSDISSGIYIVEPLNDEPVCSYSSDKRRSGQGMPIQRGMIKFGRATNLERRRKDYAKTFGDDRVRFAVIVRSVRIDEIEKSVKQRVKAFRLRSPKNRPLEWLSGISFDSLSALIIECSQEVESPQFRG